MKTLLFALLLAVAPVFAAPAPTPDDKPISLSFDKISIVTLAGFIYGDILKTNFAIHNDLIESPKAITVHFQSGFDRPKLSVFIADLLANAGVVVEQKNGYVLLRPPVVDKPESLATDVFFYRPKHRSVSYLIDVTSSLFKTGRFSGQRILRTTSLPVVPVAGAAAPVTAAPVKQEPADTGTSAQSRVDRNEQDSFLFDGTEKEIAQLQRLLVQLDTPVAEVFVKGMVYEVTTGSRDGSAFNLALTLLKGKFGLTLGHVIAGDALTFKTASIDAVFSALSTDTRFKSVSHPSVRVRSGASARFSVGADVPVLGTVQLDKNGNPVQSVDYRPSGSIFDIRPQIRDESIELAVSQQLSNFVVTTSGVNNSPTLIKREISTSIAAVDGDVIVLGGLDENKTSSDQSGFSFLPSWARSNGSDTSNTQVLLVLQVQRVR